MSEFHCLEEFKGSFDKKVDGMMKSMYYSSGKENRISDIYSRFGERHDTKLSLLKRRIKGTVKGINRAYTVLRDIADKKKIENIFAYANSMIVGSGGYYTVDYDHSIVSAAAIWILDQLSLQGNIDEIYQYLPELNDENDLYLCADIVHPQYDTDLIRAVVKLILGRSKEKYSEIVKNEVSLYVEVQGKKKDTEPRKNFENVIRLIDSKAVERAVKAYEEDVWEFYRISFSIIIPILNKAEQLEMEIAKLELESFNVDAICKSGEKMDELNDIELKTPFNSAGWPNYREEFVKEKSDLYSKEAGEKLVNFHVEDPFESAFAIIYLLDTDSIIPWYYYGSISVAFTIHSQLPFNVKKLERGDKCSFSELNSILYNSRYEVESSYDEAEKEIVNLSQLCFYYSNLIFPRVVQSVPEIEQFIETIGEASDREKGLLKVMLNMHNSTGMQNESYKMYLLNKKLLEYEEELERKNSDYFSEEKFLRLQEKADKLQEEQKILSKNLYKEENIRKSKEELYQQALAEKDMLIRELADLREMVFSFNNQVEEEETADSNIEFPHMFSRKIISFGGHRQWISEMKKLLPTVDFYYPETIPNSDLLKHAQNVWIQTNCIPHSSFYRITNYLNKHKVQIHYFRYSGAKKCAEQLVDTFEKEQK